MALNTVDDFLDAGIFPREWSLALQGELQTFSAAGARLTINWAVWLQDLLLTYAALV